MHRSQAQVKGGEAVEGSHVEAADPRRGRLRRGESPRVVLIEAASRAQVARTAQD